jgi:hypothetical protein
MAKSKNSKFLFLVILIVVVIAGSTFLVNSNSDLFKGALVLDGSTEVDLTLEAQNCSEEDCSTPSLILNTNDELSQVELLVKNSSTQEIVYADYLPAVEAGSRYEIAFSSDICGQYSFNGITNEYNLSADAECSPATYDFVISGAMQTEKAPLFVDYISFTLTN